MNASSLYFGILGITSKIQLSIHTLVSSPLPTRLIRPCDNKSRPCIMLLQAYDGRWLTPQERKDDFLKYRCFRIWANSESGLLYIIHACLPSNAWYNLAMSRKPSPPWSFGLHSFCHATHGIFFLELPLLDHNSVIALVRLVHTSFGNLK